jgi:hypothetical protein
MITLKIKVGKGMLEYQADTMKKIHAWSNTWGSLPDKCTCESDDIFLAFTKTTEGYEYCKLKCKKCGATYTIKQNKQNEYYIDPEEKFEVYQKNESVKKATNPINNEPDDSPF